MQLTDEALAEPVTLDARGQKCPLPVLRAEKALAGMAVGQQIIVLANDQMARIDIPLYCQQNGHAVSFSEDNAVLRFEIVCGGAR
jgi:tRNA 2-thiouridine synthesizing protein A